MSYHGFEQMNINGYEANYLYRINETLTRKETLFRLEFDY